MPRASRDDILSAAIKQQDASEEIDNLRLQLATSKRNAATKSASLTAALKRIELLNREFDFLRAVPPPTKVLSQLAGARRRSGSRHAVAVFPASDWHVEETVTLAETDGQNQYDLEIATQRIERWASGVVSMVEAWTSGSHAAEIDQIVVPLLGDLMNGYLREDDLIGNSLTPPQAVRWLEDRIGEAIEYMLRHLDVKIHIPCRTGNHGRLMALSNRRTIWAQKEAMSLESLLYHFLSTRFAAEPNVTFDVPDAGIWTYLDVKGTTMRLGHGDTIRYGGGIGGLTVPLMKALHRLDQQRPADFTFLGHFHQTLWHARCGVNGSLIGMNAYGVASGFQPETPQQSAFLVRQGRGVSVKQEIWVDE